MFVNSASVGEIGTSMASMYRTGKTNAAKDVHNHYNEYSEFHAREVEAHICAAFMEKMKMTKLEGNYKQMFCCNCFVISCPEIICAVTVLLIILLIHNL